MSELSRIRLPRRPRPGKRRVYLVQVNNHYGKNIFFPYSVGLLWAYARTFPEVTDCYDLAGILYRKEPIADAVARLDRPDVVAVSCYIWNWQWSKAFCAAVKQHWPECRVVVGGAQVPPETAFLGGLDGIDYALYGEGEGAFVDLLKCLSEERPDPATVGNLIYRGEERVVKNERRAFVELERLRSPYLDGVFDGIFEPGWKWQALQETHRGCPYACTFCEWGEASQNKVRPVDDARVLEEYKWFADHQVEMLYNCDANYGILKRDMAITRALVETKQARGYPQQFRAAFAKNSNEKIFDIATMLHGAGMLKAVTLAMQSMTDDVLEVIKRKNIKIENFAPLIERYEAAGMPTYTELIIGLPGETVESYVDGIDVLLDSGQHNGLTIYPCVLLPNTEMNTPASLAEHAIESVPMQAMLLHATPEPGVIIELQDVVTGTKAMPHPEWKWSFTYSWLVQTFHVLGLLQDTAIEMRRRGTPYKKFYRSLFSWLYEFDETIGGRELRAFRKLLDGALAGGSWNLVDPRYGEISWPPEEFAFLNIACDLPRFYAELIPFYDSIGAGDLVEMQRDAIVGPEPGREEAWARDVVWYGRKGYGARKRRAA